MKARFELEQRIMNVWQVFDDLNELILSWDELSEDQQMNILIGIKDLGHLKSQLLFKCFEECIKERSL